MSTERWRIPFIADPTMKPGTWTVRSSTEEWTVAAPLGWFPCEHQERPIDSGTAWHAGYCRGCRVAAEAFARRHPDNPKVPHLLESTAPGCSETAKFKFHPDLLVD